jgi:GTP pyrophosphokinase
VTPKGTVVALPKGSTPVDFAYAIHSEVGDHCKIAMVNGKVASLRHELKNGDTVNIITAKDQKPRQEWLEFAVSTRAKAKIKQAIANERREKDLLAGRAMLSAELLKAGLRIEAVTKRGDLAAVAELMKFQNAENLIVAVGSYRIKASTVVQRILPPETAAKPTPMVEQAKRFGEKLVDALMFRKASKDVIRVSGLDGATETTYARCCDPVPGDPIVGYVSRRGSIHIHNENCTRRYLLDEMRMVDVAWAPQSSSPNDKTPRRNVMIRVICHDGTGMLAEMTQALASKGVNIRNAMCRAGADRRTARPRRPPEGGTERRSRFRHAVERRRRRGLRRDRDAARLSPGACRPVAFRRRPRTGAGNRRFRPRRAADGAAGLFRAPRLRCQLGRDRQDGG